MAKKEITQHIPLVIWMDDQVKFQVDGKDIIFAGFPYRIRPRILSRGSGRWVIFAESPGPINREKVRKR